MKVFVIIILDNSEGFRRIDSVDSVHHSQLAAIEAKYNILKDPFTSYLTEDDVEILEFEMK